MTIQAQRTLDTVVSTWGRKTPFRVTIVAKYRGGAYIDLTFGNANEPTEVINVWDYRTGSSNLDAACQSDLARVLRDWILDNDNTEADDEGKPITFTGRKWLAAYYQNAR